MMFESNEFDLGRLNEAERQVLYLLAEGHTAKSIANELGSTPAAVNERLREARRKTGVGSSRELARLLKSQENRHEQMGMASRPPTAAAFPQPDAETWRPQTGVVAMLTLFLVAAAGAATLMTQSPATGDDVDPLVGAPMERFSQPADLHVQVRNEGRDEAWATRTEAGIHERYGRLSAAARSLDTLSVACGSTLCEVVGLTRSNATSDDVTTVLIEVQSGELNASIEQLGLRISSSSFTSGTGNPQGVAFVAYLERR